MSPHQNAEIVCRVYAALAEGDPTAAMALFHPEMVLIEPDSLPYGGTYKGLGEVATAIGKIATYVDLAGLTVGRVLADDDTAVAFVTATWRHRDGTTRQVPMRECYTFADGRIVEMRVFYWDVAALVET